MLKVVLVGNGELGAALLSGILNSSHSVEGVFRWENAKNRDLISKLRSYINTDPIYSIIKKHSIPEINASGVNTPEFYKQVAKINPDVLIVGSWGEILKEKVISLPKIASVNCHPSFLPYHRGSNPYSSVIKEGEDFSGVTFHYIDKGLDTGDILLQKKVPISPFDTGGSLRTKCAYTASKMVIEVLDGLEHNSLKPIKQDSSVATYYPRLTAEDAIINWERPAIEIHNHIRGLSPWIKCYTRHKNEFFMIADSHVIELDTETQKGGIILSKGEKSILVSTAERDKAILLQNLELYGFAGKHLSGYYINKFVKIGDRLEQQ